MKKFLLPLILMAAFLVSCEKQENNNAQEPEYEISIRPAELLFEAEGGEQTVTVTSKYGEEDAAWQISMDGEYGWFEVSASNGENGYYSTVLTILCRNRKCSELANFYHRRGRL